MELSEQGELPSYIILSRNSLNRSDQISAVSRVLAMWISEEKAPGKAFLWCVWVWLGQSKPEIGEKEEGQMM